VIARALHGLGAEMRLPCRLAIAGLAAEFAVPVEALERIVDELVTRGAGTHATGTWELTTSAHVEALITALGVYAG
jgi:hypothetical protein